MAAEQEIFEIDDIIELTPECVQTNIKPVCKWGEADTRDMLDVYVEVQSEVGPLKKYRTKKIMWEDIATKLKTKFGNLYNGDQVESCFKCINRRTKKAVENNCTSGASFQETPYDEEIRKIMHQDDSICPEVMVVPGRVIRKKDVMGEVGSPVAQSSTPPRPRKRNANQENFDKYIELQERKLKVKKESEEKRQERHLETIIWLKTLIDKK